VKRLFDDQSDGSFGFTSRTVLEEPRFELRSDLEGTSESGSLGDLLDPQKLTFGKGQEMLSEREMIKRAGRTAQILL